MSVAKAPGDLRKDLLWSSEIELSDVRKDRHRDSVGVAGPQMFGHWHVSSGIEVQDTPRRSAVCVASSPVVNSTKRFRQLPAICALNLIFDPTDFVSDNGLPVSRERCNFTAGWDTNNFGSARVTAKDGTSFVSQGCKDGEIGPLRDCGFSTQPIHLSNCTAGQTIHLTCKSDHSPQVIRVCEKSEALGGVDCAYRDSLANGIVNPGGTTLSFACPAVRDASVAGMGGYSVYRAPLLPSSPSEPVSCTNF